MRSFDSAGELAARIPIEAVRKSVLMHNLLARQKAPEVLARFGEEDISAWPFWKVGDGYYVRGRAYAAAGAGKQAESDLTRALEFTSDPHIRQGIWLALGSNREHTLKDDNAALAAYRAVFDTARHIGGANEFSAVQGASRILTRGGKFDDALAVLHRVEIARLRGHWRGSMLLALGETLSAAGRKEEAIAAYKAALADQTIEGRHRRTAEERIKATESKRR